MPQGDRERGRGRVVVRTDACSVTASHMLYVGDGWVPAVKVDAPWSEDGWAWHFWRVEDCLRWLAA